MAKKETPKLQVVKKDSHPKLVGAAVLITLGFVIILNNFGLLPWSTFDLISKLWPLILVFWGLKMLLK